MIWYIIITTVFLFNYGYVVCAENVLSINKATRVTVKEHKYICTIYRYNPGTRKETFMCVGVLAGSHYAITSASCVSRFSDGTQMYIHVNAEIRGEGIIYRVVGITFDPITNGPHTRIAILRVDTRIIKTETIGAINLPVQGVQQTNISVISYGRQRNCQVYTLQKTDTNILDVQNPQINSFVASNQKNNEILLDDTDIGAPAVIRAQVVGILSSTTGLPNAKATFLNIFSLDGFLRANMRRQR